MLALRRSPLQPPSNVAEVLRKACERASLFLPPQGLAVEYGENGNFHLIFRFPPREIMEIVPGETVAKLLVNWERCRGANKKSVLEALGDLFICAYYVLGAKELVDVQAEWRRRFGNVANVFFFPPLALLADLPLLAVLTSDSGGVSFPFLVSVRDGHLEVSYLNLRCRRVVGLRDGRWDLHGNTSATIRLLGEFFLKSWDFVEETPLREFNHHKSVYTTMFLKPLSSLLRRWGFPRPTVDFSSLYLPAWGGGEDRKHYAYSGLGFPLRLGRRSLCNISVFAWGFYFYTEKAGFVEGSLFPKILPLWETTVRFFLLRAVAQAMADDFVSYYGSDVSSVTVTCKEGEVRMDIWFKDAAQRALSYLQSPAPRYIAPPALRVVFRPTGGEDVVNIEVSLHFMPASQQKMASVPINLREAVFMSFYEREEAVPLWIRFMRVIGALA